MRNWSLLLAFVLAMAALPVAAVWVANVRPEAPEEKAEDRKAPEGKADEADAPLEVPALQARTTLVMVYASPALDCGSIELWELKAEEDAPPTWFLWPPDERREAAWRGMVMRVEPGECSSMMFRNGGVVIDRAAIEIAEGERVCLVRTEFFDAPESGTLLRTITDFEHDGGQVTFSSGATLELPYVFPPPYPLRF